MYTYKKGKMYTYKEKEKCTRTKKRKNVHEQRKGKMYMYKKRKNVHGVLSAVPQECKNFEHNDKRGLGRNSQGLQHLGLARAEMCGMWVVFERLGEF